MNEVGERRLVSVKLNADAQFVFPEGDPFWARRLLRGKHEPEIDEVLRRAAAKPYVLFDAGANFGYWSVLASSEPYGRHAAIAIEASHDNFQLLLRNVAANGDRFQALHRAIFDVSGTQVSLYGRKHFGLSLRKDWHPDDNDRSEAVESITLDAVAERYFPRRKFPPILKIDVEGVEIEGILGARGLLDEGALVIYEDHGKEPSHRISRFVLALDDIAIWYVGREGGQTRITALDQLDAVKQHPKLGYNFFAYRRSSPWSAIFEG